MAPAAMSMSSTRAPTRLSVIDPVTNAVTATIPVGGSPWRISFTRFNNYLLALNTNGNNTIRRTR